MSFKLVQSQDVEAARLLQLFDYSLVEVQWGSQGYGYYYSLAFSCVARAVAYKSEAQYWLRNRRLWGSHLVPMEHYSMF